MKIINTYSFKGGEDFLKQKHPKELKDVLGAVKALDADFCLNKRKQRKNEERTNTFLAC